jgi:hypothetical protein
MHVAGSLNFTEACAIPVEVEEVTFPLHPAMIAAIAPTGRSAKKNSSRETLRPFTRKVFLEFSASMATATFQSVGE